MAKTQKTRFVATGEDGRFQFHSGDGRLHVVDGAGFETSDPAVIALLDAAPHVKREAKSSGGKKKPARELESAEPAADDDVVEPADNEGGGS